MAANGTSTSFIASWLQILAPGQCYDEFFVNFNFFHLPCLKLLIIKCLGYSIILGSSIVKLPQVLKIFGAKSGEGISLSAVLLELVAILSTATYSIRRAFPFSSYGEGVFLTIQTVVIAFMVMFYSGKTLQALMTLMVTVLSVAFLLSPAAPMSLLSFMQTGNIFIVLSGKFMQAFANFKNGSTGQLSFITLILLLLGSIARIFTSIQETGDSLVILSYLIASFFNAIIFGQLLYYWNVPLQGKEAQAAGDVKKKKN